MAVMAWKVTVAWGVTVTRKVAMLTIKTSELDWKKEMLLIMQHKYNEVDKINEWWEQVRWARSAHESPDPYNVTLL